jgi:hypothetical protein
MISMLSPGRAVRGAFGPDVVDPGTERPAAVVDLGEA